jgi:hypothetical protein
MSALGQKRTFAVHKPMSALPPKADMCSALGHVCFGPIADITAVTRVRLRALHKYMERPQDASFSQRRLAAASADSLRMRVS